MEKATQTYDKYCLGAKIEEMIYKILKNEAKCKYFIGLFPEQFYILFDFLGETKYALNYWNASSQRKNKCIYIKKQNATDKKRSAVYNITETSSRV